MVSLDSNSVIEETFLCCSTYGIFSLSGLDPALPLFTLGNKDARLDKHDARHVEVIHTCGGYLGFSSPLGHIDFYPNGGTRQPGCGFDYRGESWCLASIYAK